MKGDWEKKLKNGAMFDDKNSFSNSWIITFFQKKFDLFWDCLNLVLNQLGFANGKVLQCGSHSPTAYFWNPLNKCSKHIGHEELSNCLLSSFLASCHRTPQVKTHCHHASNVNKFTIFLSRRRHHVPKWLKTRDLTSDLY